MKLSDFMYDLPEERIAQTPVEPRDHSRLMVLDRESHCVEHKHFYDIIDYLNPGDVLVVPYSTHEMLPYMRQAAAVISEESSMDGHAATVGLALDLPVIVGASGATRRLQDGVMVSVDCARGIVQTMLR